MGIIKLEFVSSKKADSYTCLQSDNLGNCIQQIKTGEVMLWKFKDENGNLWNTETTMNGTEDQAREIILGLS